MSDWISVEDRLPIVESELNLLRVKYKTIEVICFDGNEVYCDIFNAGNTFDFWSEFEGCEDHKPKPTHWMHLPSPPST